MAKYWPLLLQLLSALLMILPAATSTAAACHPDDLSALRGFAGNLSGGAAVLLRATWSGASCCGWEGVRCDDGASGRVTTLWLPGRGLVGPIHGASSLAGLAQLESLNLANNRLHVGTTFPSWIVSELGPEDTSRNIIEIIFQSSWLKKQSPVCAVDRILKVHNAPATLARFEAHRDAVKAKALAVSSSSGGGGGGARCTADGNELLRFHCAALACSLGC